MLKKLLFCLVSIALPVVGQMPATGVYPYSTFDSRGFDAVNVGNLDLHFSIPIVNRTGRGLAFSYTFNYEGLLWSPILSSSTGATTWVPDPTWGFQGLLNGSGFKGYLTWTVRSNSCGGGTTRSGGFQVNTISNYTYHDEFGILHRFKYTYQQTCPNSGTGPTISGDGSSTDSSGYTLNLKNTTQVFTRSGSVISPAFSATGQDPTSLIDSNGNKINSNGSGTFTDTLGVNALTVSGSNPRTFTYPVTRQANGATTATTVLSYRTYTVRTMFNCSGVGEYGSSSTSLPDRVTLADGTFYAFTYEGTPGATDGAVTGRLGSVTLPTGGTIGYSYSAGCGAGLNADGTGASLTRTTSDGKRTYTRAPINSNASSTTVQDEKGNQTYYAFTIDSASQRFFETHRQVYQGQVGGTPLQDQLTCYNGSPGYCDGVSMTLPITEADAINSFNGGSQNVTKNSYDPNGNLLLSSAILANGTLLASHVNTYNANGEIASAGDYVGPNAPSSANCSNWSVFNYDEGTLTATSGIPQHVAPGATRGNLTSSYTSAGGVYLGTHATYYDTGVPVNTTAQDGGVTSYGYDPTQAFVTSTSLPVPSSGVAMSTSAQFDVNTTASLSTTGVNGDTTTVNQFDALMRPIDVSLPSGSHLTTPINTVNHKFWNQTLDANRTGASEIVMDGYGRVTRKTFANGQSGNGWYQMDTCFDATGFPQFQSTPYQSTGINTTPRCSGSGTSYQYDALGRVTSVTNDDGTATTQYQGRAVKQTDVNGVAKITQYDLQGRLSGVCEISSNSLAGQTPTACGMDIAGTGYITGYNISNNQTTITQAGRTRIFSYDPAGRPIQIVEPERGTTNLSYSFNNTGLAVTRTRPKANQTNASTLTTTTTQYDKLSRVTQIRYDDGLTREKDFLYDVFADINFPNGVSNVKGRMVGNYSYYNTRAQYSYDIAGNVTTMWQCGPSNCGGSNQQGRPALTYTYDLTGAVMSAFDGASGNIVYTRSNGGEVTSVTNQSYTDAVSMPNLVSGVLNGPFGVVSYTTGNSLNIFQDHDSLGRKTGNYVCHGAAGPNCNGEIYGQSNSFKGAQVSGMCDTVLGTCETHVYDEFNRLIAANGSTSYAYSYDRWGNRVSGNGFTSSFNGSNEDMGLPYDAAGNVLSDGVHSFTYDAEGKVVQVDSGSTASYAYDAMDHRVRVTAQGKDVEYMFDPFGRRQSTWNVANNAGIGGSIYWDYGLLANRSQNGFTYLHHHNYLGTTRMRTDYQARISSTEKSGPFGENFSEPAADGSATQDNSQYTGQEHDVESNTEHFQYRQYTSRLGHWLSPDPYTGSYDPSNPQSLNRYAFVLNNPLGYTDPTGLDEGCVNSDDPYPADGSNGYPSFGVSSQPCLNNTDGEENGATPAQDNNGVYTLSVYAFAPVIQSTTPSYTASFIDPRPLLTNASSFLIAQASTSVAQSSGPVRTITPNVYLGMNIFAPGAQTFAAICRSFCDVAYNGCRLTVVLVKAADRMVGGIDGVGGGAAQGATTAAGASNNDKQCAQNRATCYANTCTSGEVGPGH